jgi:threonine/homoserine/homoserine lactone efflux protein
VTLGTHDLWLFVLSGLLLNITPGPDTLYIIGRSSTQGRRAGAVAALGIGAGWRWLMNARTAIGCNDLRRPISNPNAR